MSEWSNFYQKLPITMKRYLNKRIKGVSDFINKHTPEGSLYISPTTKIELSFSIEDGGLLLAIWFPDAEDPTYTEHQIYIRNPFCDLIAN